MNIIGPETPAEHIRNALQILKANHGDIPGTDFAVAVTVFDLNAVEARLIAALRALERPQSGDPIPALFQGVKP